MRRALAAALVAAFVLPASAAAHATLRRTVPAFVAVAVLLAAAVLVDSKPPVSQPPPAGAAPADRR